MSTLLKVIAVLTAAITLYFSSGFDLPIPSITANKQQPTGLVKVSSEQSFENQLKSSLTAQYGKISEPIYYLASTNDKAPKHTSTTNLQESNVDEADRLKTDGKYLYLSKVNSPEINIFAATKNNAVLVSSLKIKTINKTKLSGLYLREKSQQLLAVAGDGQHNLSIWNNWSEPSFWKERKTELFSVDISRPKASKQTHKVSIDGQMISSRRIGSTLYLATRHTSHIAGLITHPADDKEVAHNQQLITATSLDQLLPRYQIGEQLSQPLFSAAECFMTETGKQSNSIISLLAIDLDNVSAKPTGQCFTGETETVYASSEAIYLATTQYASNRTQIHKFSLATATPSYAGSGSVQGHLGWQQDLKPFRMSEYKGVLRVMTYVGDQVNAEASPARLSTLAENSATDTLDVLAQLPNEQRPEPLGKLGEQIYASRFMGERGYLVTFRMTDPLYVLDLSDPADPFIASALEIDGYSDYLHPVGEHYLLGIGKNAVADTTNGDGRDAWYQGVKLSLIDISNPAAPTEKQTIDIGKRGTETAVTQTHHAFTSLQQGNNLHVALPVSLHDTVSDNVSEDTTKPWFNYQWTRNQLNRFSIDTVNGEIKRLPSIIAKPTDATSYPGSGWAYDRSAIIGESIYYVNEDTVTVSSL